MRVQLIERAEKLEKWNLNLLFLAQGRDNPYGATNTMYVTAQLRACAVVLIAEHCQLAI